MLRTTVPRKPLIAAVAVAAALVAAGGWAASGSGDEPPRPVAAHADAARRAELPPLPAHRSPTVVEPVAGGAAAAEPAPASSAPASRAPVPAASAPARARVAAPDDLALSRPSTAGDGVHDATALPNGIALPPLEAPTAVRQIIEAGNVIARTPYLWGGGHGKWLDTGYDCSGSVSFALAAAGLLDAPLASGPLMSWGEAGAGKWVTIWSSPAHVFMEVAGIRFDTSGQRVTGSRWQNDMRSTAGFVARHPHGL
jgi:cell wall-associated NlpC family hydrolase